MIVHNDRPEDLETQARFLDTWITPIEAFFVRQHLPRPSRIDRDDYRLNVNGMVSKPLELTLEDLKKLPQYTVPATIECTGNGRAFYSPKVPGIQWRRGAIGNAEWRGPRVSDVLKMAGANSSAAFIEVDGADSGLASTPDFVRSLPMTKAMHPATILALTMNGETPDMHGFPVRLIVPGWDGTSSVKWVVRITANAQEGTGFFMNPGYRYPKFALPPGTPPRPAELEVIEGMPVKSLHHGAGRSAEGGPRSADHSRIRLGRRERHRTGRGIDGWRQPLARCATFTAETALRMAAVQPGMAAARSRATIR